MGDLKKENRMREKNAQWKMKLLGQQLAAIQSRCPVFHCAFYTLPFTKSNVH